MNDNLTEPQISALSGRRITPSPIDAEIRSEHYFIAGDAIQLDTAVHEFPEDEGWLLGRTQVVTICVIQLKNGFVVTGDSAPADSANFDAQKGREAARENAVEKIWPLLGFRLRDELARGTAQG